MKDKNPNPPYTISEPQKESLATKLHTFLQHPFTTMKTIGSTGGYMPKGLGRAIDQGKIERSAFDMASDFFAVSSVSRFIQGAAEKDPIKAGFGALGSIGPAARVYRGLKHPGAKEVVDQFGDAITKKAGHYFDVPELINPRSPMQAGKTLQEIKNYAEKTGLGFKLAPKNTLSTDSYGLIPKLGKKLGRKIKAEGDVNINTISKEFLDSQSQFMSHGYGRNESLMDKKAAKFTKEKLEGFFKKYDIPGSVKGKKVKDVEFARRMSGTDISLKSKQTGYLLKAPKVTVLPSKTRQTSIALNKPLSRTASTKAYDLFKELTNENKK